MDISPDDLTSVPVGAEDGTDIYSQLLGSDPNTAGHLRRTNLLGQILQSTGDRALAPLGEGMSTQTQQDLGEATHLRQAMAQLAATNAYRKDMLDTRKSYEQQSLADREQAEADREQDRKLQLTLAQLNSQNKMADPNAVDATAAAIRRGEQQIPNGYVLSTPFGQAVLARTHDPSFLPDTPYDPSLFPARQRSLENLQKDDTVRRLGVAQNHLQQLGALSDALGSPAGSQHANQLVQYFQNEFGDPRITNYNTAANIVANEVANALAGARGSTEKDREKEAAGLAASLTGGQRAGAMRTYLGLMQGQMNGKRKQYGLVSDADWSRIAPSVTVEGAPAYAGGATGAGKAMPAADKLGAYAQAHFGGDVDKAAQFLRSQGYQ